MSPVDKREKKRGRVPRVETLTTRSLGQKVGSKRTEVKEKKE